MLHDSIYLSIFYLDSPAKIPGYSPTKLGREIPTRGREPGDGHDLTTACPVFVPHAHSVPSVS